MSENVELQKIRVDRVIIKVGGDDVARHIICRMLNRSEPVDVHAFGQNNDAARMLAGRSSDTGASLGETLKFARSLGDSLILEIVHGQPVGSLVSDRADRARLESLTGAEDYFRVCLGDALLVSGEVEVDIRLLISLESEERLERDVEAELAQLMSADRAYLIRHVRSAPAAV